MGSEWPPCVVYVGLSALFQAVSGNHSACHCDGDLVPSKYNVRVHWLLLSFPLSLSLSLSSILLDTDGHIKLTGEVTGGREE